MHQKRQLVTLRQSLAQWRHSVIYLKQMIDVTEQMGLYKRTQLIRKVFKSLKMVTRAKRAGRNLRWALLEKSIYMRKQAILHAFVGVAQSRRTNRHDTHVARSHNVERVRRATLFALRTYSRESRRLKCLAGAAMFRRLVPKAFACLQMHSRVSIVKRKMRHDACQFHHESLVRKTLTSLAFNARSKLVSNERHRVAKAFARRQLCARAFGRLVVGMCVVKNTQEKRSCLFRAVNRWANYTTQKTVFKQFQTGLAESRKELVEMRDGLERSKRFRAFQAWQSLKSINLRCAQAGQAVAQTRKVELQREFFGQWV